MLTTDPRSDSFPLHTHTQKQIIIEYQVDKILKREIFEDLYFLFQSKVNEEVQILKCARI